MKIELGRIQRLKLMIFGKVYVGMKTRPGWSGDLPFYIFKCPVHGLVEDYSHGWKKKMRCPECVKK